MAITLELLRHTQSSLKLRFGSNLNADPSDKSWGVTNVYVEPLNQEWPDMDDFREGSNEWQGNGGNTVAVTTCGLFGTVLGGYNVLGANAFVEKTYRLPAHTGLQIELDYVYIDVGLARVLQISVFLRYGLSD